MNLAENRQKSTAQRPDRAQLFYAEDARKYGLDGAVMLNHFRLWLDGHLAAGRNVRDGEVWNWITVANLAELYPYWTVEQVRRILKRLIEAGALRTANHNKAGFDRTLWYTIPGYLDECGNADLHLVDSPNGFGENPEPIPETTQKPSQNPPHKPPTKRGDPDFDKFWEVYPRKVGKGAARREYERAKKKCEGGAAVIHAGLERYVAKLKRDGTEPQFIAHPRTWLAQERWEDEEPPPPGGHRPNW